VGCMNDVSPLNHLTSGHEYIRSAKAKVADFNEYTNERRENNIHLSIK
jgi:hypothetical protein